MKENPLKFLDNRQKNLVKKEMKEEGYCVLQRWTNKKGNMDYRVLKDTVIVTPNKIYDRIRWVFKKIIQ